MPLVLTRARRAGGAALVGTVALAMTCATATTATAATPAATAPAPATATVPAVTTNEVTVRPADGVLHLVGKGFGHGRGMSQYGAYRAALLGKGWGEITSFYYPGTTRTVLANRPIRVAVDGRLGRSVRVKAEPGLVAVVDGVSKALPTVDTVAGVSTPITAWEVDLPSSPSSTALALWFRTSAGARKALTSSATGRISLQQNTTGVLSTFTSTGQAGPRYRGSLAGVRSGSILVPVLTTPLETYLRGVVPAESPGSWPVQALAAQAVAARTYAAYFLAHPRSAGYDLCDTSTCQNFAGTRVETASADAAVAATAGVTLTYGGVPIDAQFSSSNGSMTADGRTPYLPAKADPWDRSAVNPMNSWSAAVPVSALERAYPAIGAFTRLVVVSRDGRGELGGRITGARVEGSGGSVTVTGDALRSALGTSVARSTLFTVATPTPAAFPRDLSGDRAADLLLRAPSGALTQRTKVAGTAGTTISAVPSFSVPAGVASAPGAAGVLATSRSVATAGRIAGTRDTVVALTGTGTLQLLRVTAASATSTTTSVGSPVTVRTDLTGAVQAFGVGDLNGDGQSDVLVRFADGTLRRVSSNGTGGLLAGLTTIGTGWQIYRDVLPLGDITGDGRPDLVARDAAGTLWLYTGDGRDGLQPRVQLATGFGGYPALAGVGDLTGDGRGDLLATDSAGSTWLVRGRALSSTTATLDPRQRLTTTTPGRWL